MTAFYRCQNCGVPWDKHGTACPITCDSTFQPPPPAQTPHKCPVCDGTGLVSKPPHIAGDQQTWTDSSAGPYPCGVCNGEGVLMALVTAAEYRKARANGTLHMLARDRNRVAYRRAVQPQEANMLKRGVPSKRAQPERASTSSASAAAQAMAAYRAERDK